jgi:hypothetical protein
MNKFVFAIAVVLAPTQVTAFQGISDIHWTDQLSHSIPSWDLHCLNDVFSREGLDAALGIKGDDPQVAAIKRHCQTHQPVVPGLWPAAGDRLGKSQERTHGRRHVRHRRRQQ